MQIPIFPLNAILFPGGYLPLNIFEPRYKAMVKKCVMEQSPFGVALIKQGMEARGPAVPYSVGTLAYIVQVDPPHDSQGSFTMLCRGGERFRIKALDRSAAEYLTAEVDLYPDEEAPPPALAMVAERVAGLFDEYYRSVVAMTGGWQKETDRGGRTWLIDLATLGDKHTQLMEGKAKGEIEPDQLPRLQIPALPDDASALSFVVAAELTASHTVKQDLLEAPTALARLQREAEVLTEEMADISERVRIQFRRRFAGLGATN